MRLIDIPDGMYYEFTWNGDKTSPYNYAKLAEGDAE